MAFECESCGFEWERNKKDDAKDDAARQEASEVITEFRGKWTKLSNYSIVSIWYKDHMYPSVEHAYQAAKSTDPVIQQMVRNLATPNLAKKMGKEIQDNPLIYHFRQDFHNVKIGIMYDLLVEKFKQEPERTLLLSSGTEKLVEGNWWGDKFWGQCPVGDGENHLGKLLMQIRKELIGDAPRHLS